MIDLLVSLAIGAVAGWLASIIMGSKGGLLKNIILGIVGLIGIIIGVDVEKNSISE